MVPLLSVKPDIDMEKSQPVVTQKSYRRVNIPKEKHRILGMIPAIRDAAGALYERCTCTPKIRGEIRPATGADEEFFTALADLFRCYRWLAGTADPEDEKGIEEYTTTTIKLLQKGLDVVERIIPLLDPNAAHPWIRVPIRDSLACGMQTLANCFGRSRKVQNQAWSDFCEIIGSCILLHEDKLLNYVSAALLNCLKDDDARLFPMANCGYAAGIFERVAQLTNRDDLIETFEAVFDLAARLLRCPVIAERDFGQVSLATRCAIVDMLSFAFSLNDQKDCTNQLLPHFWAEKVAEVFKLHWNALLRLKDPCSVVDQEAELSLKALDLLGNITAANSLRVFFHHDVELLDSVIDAFVAVDSLSREGENLFTPVNKLADVKPQELVTSARGIKSLLIRLLANLVYNNSKFIQRASERKLLQRLKDNTKIDYRNPYVQQWAILAIRNLHLTDAFEEVRREHVIVDVPESPVAGRVSQSVDGDLVGERRLTDMRNSPMKGRPPGRSDTVEALDLHTSFNEPALPPLNLPSSSRRKHQSSHGRKNRDVSIASIKSLSDQSTQTVPTQFEEDKSDDLNDALEAALDDGSVPSSLDYQTESLATSPSASDKPRHQSR
ncbi:hypothetical protein RvY_05616 [Ramazzottius varieornatus]|uniref:Ataxin-10 domain-containing protein n=1 Tax=Ramazzottius varieornatus TaxID=947166 RepID=A0A1D1V193_RAMVA|nr:hypothetical protein RvY_05616 [Ramazzottius varieornatus]